MEHSKGNVYLVKRKKEKNSKGKGMAESSYPSIETLREVKVFDISDRAVEFAFKDNYNSANKLTYFSRDWYEKGDFEKAYEIVEILDIAKQPENK